MFLFRHATGSGPFSWLGQKSGVGTQNPGMGIWVYSLMAKGLGLTSWSMAMLLGWLAATGTASSVAHMAASTMTALRIFIKLPLCLTTVLELAQPPALGFRALDARRS